MEFRVESGWRVLGFHVVFLSSVPGVLQGRTAVHVRTDQRFRCFGVGLTEDSKCGLSV